MKKKNYKDLREKFPDYVIFIEAGTFFEVKDEGARILSSGLNYKLFQENSTRKILIPNSEIEAAIDYIRGKKYKYIVVENFVITEKYDRGKPVEIEEKETEIENKENFISELKQFRLNIALQNNVPAYCVFQNKALEGVIKNPPSNLEELRKIKGFGKKTAEKYGDELLKIVFKYTGQKAPLVENKEVEEESEDFKKIIKFIEKGKNIFITGSAGTGKSYILNKLKEKYGKTLELTGTTGLAAVNIKGMTIHSWAGVGICKKTVEKCVEDIYKKKSVLNKIKKAKLLAIDEISMLKGENFTYIDNVLKLIRGNLDPFGGLQLILIGDFFQLPPVEIENREKDFCFETRVWQDLNLEIVKLDKIYRQEEKEFVKALNDIRTNSVDEDDINLLKSRETIQNTTNTNMLHIFSRNDEADGYNLEKFNELSSKTYSYKAISGVYRGKNFVTEDLSEQEKRILEIFNKSCKASETLNLKEGARVMLIINLDFTRGLINGACGRVVALDENGVVVRFDNGVEEDIPMHKFEFYHNDKLLASITQYPLKLAYAVTIHKSQGMTLENVVVDCNKIFEQGQTYVALSRVKKLSGLYLKGFSPQKIKVNQKVVDFYKNL